MIRRLEKALDWVCKVLWLAILAAFLLILVLS